MKKSTKIATKNDLIHSADKLESFLKEFMIKFRAKLPPKLPPYFLFSEPCQIHIIWFRPFDQQFFYVTHFENLEDGLISIFFIENERAYEMLQKWTELPSWSKNKELVFDHLSVGETVLQAVKEMLDIHSENITFYWIFNKREEPKITPIDHAFFNSWMNGFRIVYDGLIELNMKKWIDTLLKNLPREIPSEFVEQKHNAYGVSFFPTIYLGGFPIKEVKHVVDKNTIKFDRNEIVIESAFRGKKFWVSKTGYIYLEGIDKDEALELLNEFMAIIFIKEGIPTESIKESELGSGIINYQKREMSWIYPLSSRREWLYTKDISLKDFGKIEEINRVITDNYNILYHGYTSNKLLILPISKFEKIIERANKFPYGFVKILSLILESYSFFKGGNYIGSFLLNWIIIEGMIIEKWKNYLKRNYEGEINSKERRGMWDSPMWTISIILRSMQISNQINSDLVDLILGTKTIRNDLIHKWFRKKVKLDRQRSMCSLSLTLFLFSLFIDKKSWSDLSSEDCEIINSMLKIWGKNNSEIL